LTFYASVAYRTTIDRTSLELRWFHGVISLSLCSGCFFVVLQTILFVLLSVRILHSTIKFIHKKSDSGKRARANVLNASRAFESRKSQRSRVWISARGSESALEHRKSICRLTLYGRKSVKGRLKAGKRIQLNRALKHKANEVSSSPHFSTPKQRLRPSQSVYFPASIHSFIRFIHSFTVGERREIIKTNKKCFHLDVGTTHSRLFPSDSGTLASRRYYNNFRASIQDHSQATHTLCLAKAFYNFSIVYLTIYK
jgi:hypothetical protein